MLLCLSVPKGTISRALQFTFQEVVRPEQMQHSSNLAQKQDDNRPKPPTVQDGDTEVIDPGESTAQDLEADKTLTDGAGAVSKTSGEVLATEPVVSLDGVAVHLDTGAQPPNRTDEGVRSTSNATGEGKTSGNIEEEQGQPKPPTTNVVHDESKTASQVPTTGLEDSRSADGDGTAAANASDNIAATNLNAPANSQQTSAPTGVVSEQDDDAPAQKVPPDPDAGVTNDDTASGADANANANANANAKNKGGPSEGDAQKERASTTLPTQAQEAVGAAALSQELTGSAASTATAASVSSTKSKRKRKPRDSNFKRRVSKRHQQKQVRLALHAHTVAFVLFSFFVSLCFLSLFFFFSLFFFVAIAHRVTLSCCLTLLCLVATTTPTG